MSGFRSNFRPIFLCFLALTLSFELPDGVVGNSLIPGANLGLPLLNPLNNAITNAVSPVSSILGGSNSGGLVGNTIKLASGSLTGLTSGLASASTLGGLAAPVGDALTSSTGLINGLTNKISNVITGTNLGASSLAHVGAQGSIGAGGLGLHVHEPLAAIAGAPAHLLQGGSQVTTEVAGSVGSALQGALSGAAGLNAALAGIGSLGSSAAEAQRFSQAEASTNLHGNLQQLAGANLGSATAASLAENLRTTRAINEIAAAQTFDKEAAQIGLLQGSIAGRQALASDAFVNAQGESAIAGADMVAHGTNNAHSASLASNAYRQAKLATARDRVNIAGTIQNSARISDAAIATHDAATKAEDSLLGSELAVDSAATVLDSDGAYIPPVTSSLLRSLPYGRIGIRNIVPRPLTYPSALLPDFWLDGQSVRYMDVPLRQLIYGNSMATTAAGFKGHSLPYANWRLNQPLLSNNGLMFSNLVMDPYIAYLMTGAYGPIDSSILPILSNGQLEAQDEVAMANQITSQLASGSGSASTYHGFGRLNPVPLLTGSVSAANLAPSTTIGTTYPIGSALVIQPRDSFFQDYIDNASSRQNFDERQQ